MALISGIYGSSQYLHSVNGETARMKKSYKRALAKAQREKEAQRKDRDQRRVESARLRFPGNFARSGTAPLESPTDRNNTANPPQEPGERTNPRRAGQDSWKRKQGESDYKRTGNVG